MRKSGAVLIGLLLVSFPSVLFPKVMADVSVSCGTTITSNTTLMSDVLNCQSDGIVIGADNISLDCHGHKVTMTSNVGSQQFYSGIRASNRQNVTILNCLVQGFNSADIFLDSTTGSLLINNTASDAPAGIFIARSSNNTIRSNTALRNYQGFDLDFSDYNIFTSNLALYNSDQSVSHSVDGFRLWCPKQYPLFQRHGEQQCGPQAR